MTASGTNLTHTWSGKLGRVWLSWLATVVATSYNGAAFVQANVCVYGLVIVKIMADAECISWWQPRVLPLLKLLQYHWYRPLLPSARIQPWVALRRCCSSGPLTTTRRTLLFCEYPICKWLFGAKFARRARSTHQRRRWPRLQRNPQRSRIRTLRPQGWALESGEVKGKEQLRQIRIVAASLVANN